MAFTVLNVLIFVAGLILLDWLAFASWLDRLPGLLPRGERSYRDMFFPRILVVVAAAVPLAYGASRGPGADIAVVAGLVLFVFGHMVQYFRVFFD